MKTFAVLILAAVTALTATGARADELSARVRTWAGAELDLGGASIAAPYTIPAPPQTSDGDRTGSSILTMVPSIIPPAASGTGGSSSMGGQEGGYGQAGRAGADKALPQPVQGIKTVQTVALYRAGVEYRVPISRLASLTFRRQHVHDSALPPYLAPDHYRYAATAVLSDGSTVDADYVNLGTAILLGQSPQGHVEVPWTEIEVVRFGR